MIDIPDSHWYANLSQERGIAFRCPFTSVESCPRYYQSLSLLGEAGSTKIPDSEDQRLLKNWKRSDLWPRTSEQATSIVGPPGNPTMYSNFCPEVLFKRFGFFAIHLSKYWDEIDSDVAHQNLESNGAPSGHPSWKWRTCVSQHFSECPIYNVLSHRSKSPTSKSEPWWWMYLDKIIAVVVAIVGIIAKIIG